jgi:hypothetical protein
MMATSRALRNTITGTTQPRVQSRVESDLQHTRGEAPYAFVSTADQLKGNLGPGVIRNPALSAILAVDSNSPLDT